MQHKEICKLIDDMFKEEPEPPKQKAEERKPEIVESKRNFPISNVFFAVASILILVMAGYTMWTRPYSKWETILPGVHCDEESMKKLIEEYTEKQRTCSHENMVSLGKYNLHRPNGVELFICEDCLKSEEKAIPGMRDSRWLFRTLD